MKFNYSKGLEHEPEHFKKVKEFDMFLEALSTEYKEEFSKEIYTSKRFMVFGIGINKIIYTPLPEVPKYIEEKIKKELQRLYP